MEIYNSYHDAAHVSKLKNFNFSQRFLYNTLLPVFAREVKKATVCQKVVLPVATVGILSCILRKSYKKPDLAILHVRTLWIRIS